MFYIHFINYQFVGKSLQTFFFLQDSRTNNYYEHYITLNKLVLVYDG